MPGVSPRRCPQPLVPAARSALLRMAVAGGGQLRDERQRRDLTLEEVAHRAGVGRSTIQRLESGEPSSLETYARVASALALRPDLVFADPARRERGARADEDVVHSAMGEVEARRLAAAPSLRLAIDEPYQHFQF